ncbi:MAG TPA: MarR family transcriptional regulator [Steroidobacteraceae bacterium]|jgi:DNA-binding MarR family transcriptional regulator
MPRKALLESEDLDRNPAGVKLAFGGLDELLGYRLRRAQGAMHRHYMICVGELDLTQKQTATLWLISSNPGVSQVDVAATLGMDRATMMAIVDRLEGRGLVLRKRSAADRRRQELYLTPAGQSLLRKVKKRIALHEDHFKSHFTRPELEGLVAALQKFRDVS